MVGPSTRQPCTEPSRLLLLSARRTCNEHRQVPERRRVAHYYQLRRDAWRQAIVRFYLASSTLRRTSSNPHRRGYYFITPRSTLPSTSKTIGRRRSERQRRDEGGHQHLLQGDSFERPDGTSCPSAASACFAPCAGPTLWRRKAKRLHDATPQFTLNGARASMEDRYGTFGSPAAPRGLITNKSVLD